MTKFFCTYCGQKLSAKESLYGTFVSCPACKNSIEVPDFLKPQTNRFNTIPLSVPPPATPGGGIAGPASPVAVIPPPAAPAAVLPPPAAPAAVLAPPEPSAPIIPAPEPIAEEPLPTPPAATLPPAAPIPAPASPAAALPPAVSAEPPPAPAPPAIPSDPTAAPTYYPKPGEYTSPPAAPASALPPADSVTPVTTQSTLSDSPPTLPSSFFHQAPAAQAADSPLSTKVKNPALSTVLSILLPGLGQIYCGQWIIGPILMALTLFLYYCLIFFGLPLHLYLIADAHRSAKAFNARNAIGNQPDGTANSPAADAGRHVKDPTFATVISIFFPGMGQIYNGQIIMGLILMPLTLIFYYGFILFGLPLHLYLIADAHRTAKAINARSLEEHARIAAAKRNTYTPRNITIASVAILCAIGVIVWKLNAKEPDSAGEPVAKETVATEEPAESTEIADIPLADGSVHFSEPHPNGWVPTKFHRLRLELPARPHTHTSEPPAAASHLIVRDQYDERKIRNNEYQLTILHTTFVRPANMEGAIDGAINNVSLLPSVSGFDYETEKTTLSGLPIAYVKMRYTMKNEPQLHQSIFLVDDHEMWTINIIGRAKDIPDLWKRIRASIKIEEPQ